MPHASCLTLITFDVDGTLTGHMTLVKGSWKAAVECLWVYIAHARAFSMSEIIGGVVCVVVNKLHITHYTRHPCY